MFSGWDTCEKNKAVFPPTDMDCFFPSDQSQIQTLQRLAGVALYTEMHTLLNIWGKEGCFELLLKWLKTIQMWNHMGLGVSALLYTLLQIKLMACVMTQPSAQEVPNVKSLHRSKKIRMKESESRDWWCLNRPSDTDLLLCHADWHHNGNLHAGS